MFLLRKTSVRRRILILLTLLVGVNLFGSLVTLWYVQRTQTLFSQTLAPDLAALAAAQRLEHTLAEQKGLLTYYSLSRDPGLLEELSHFEQDFERRLREARESVQLAEGRRLLNIIESSFLHYVFSRNKVLELYQEGKEPGAMVLHPRLRDQFAELSEQCTAFKTLLEGQIVRSARRYEQTADWITTMALVAVPGSLLLGLFLVWYFVRNILEPIRRLAYGEGQEFPADGNEVQALSDRMQALLQNVDNVQSKLDRSREQMLHTEKLAVVGKMAAGVAHSIRNPLTSVKMRLFTLERGLELDPQHQEDFDVIREEIRHIDAILRNFLEFSRPPKLQMQPVSLSDVVDMTLQLLRHRLDSFNVTVDVRRSDRLPKVPADPDQIKEALMNLLLNACEAMGEKGGQITITEEEGVVEPWGRVCILRIRDNGPGIPENIRAQILEPFFSTKEDGTGLGLSIVKRIMDEHGGWVHLHSQEGEGATFVLGLPSKDREKWLRS